MSSWNCAVNPGVVEPIVRLAEALAVTAGLVCDVAIAVRFSDPGISEVDRGPGRDRDDLQRAGGERHLGWCPGSPPACRGAARFEGERVLARSRCW